MAFRSDIVAGKAVILVSIEDTIDKQLRSIRNKVFKFSNTLARVGGEFTLFGSIGSAGALFPVKEFVNFQDQLLFTQTKLRATDQEMKALEVTIRELGKSTSFTSIEVGKSAQRLAQAGFSLREVQNALQASLDLARGGQVDLATSTDILANTIRAYALNTTDASLVASKFITAARLGTLDIVDLNEALKNSATTFNLLGLNLDQSLALITRLSTASLRGTIAGTSLNRAFQKLAIENEKLARVGVSFTDEDFATPLGVLTKINEVVETLGKQESVGFLNDLVGIRGGRAVGGILIQGLGGLDDTVKQIAASTNEARDAALKLDSALGGVYRRGLSGFQELLIAIGATTEGPLTTFGENLRLIFNNLSQLATANPEFVQTLLVIPPLALAAGAGMLTLSFALSKVGLLLSPIIALNGALFASLQKIASVNIAGIGKAVSLGLSPGRKLLAKAGAEDAAVAAGFARLNRAKRQTDVTKARQAIVAAGRSRSVLTKPIKLGRFLRYNLGGSSTGLERPISDVARRSAVRFGRRFGAAISKETGPVIKGLNGLIENSTKKQSLTPILGRGKATQLGLFNGLQDTFKLGTRQALTNGITEGLAVTKYNASAEALIADSVNKVLGSKKARKALQASTSPEKLLKQRVGRLNVPAQLVPRVLKDAADRLPTKATPAATIAKQLAFNFKEPAKQLVLGFDDAVGTAAKGAGRKLSLAEIRGEKYFAQTAKTAASGRRGLGLTTIVSRLVKSFTGSAITNIVKGLKGIGSGFGALLRYATKFNYLRGFINIFKGLRTSLRFLFVALNGARRFIFSFSGILTIIEFLILLGPKIPPIATALNALGKAFKGLFSELGATLKGIGPGLTLLTNGIKELATGNTEAGLNRIKTAFAGIAEVISTGLTSAWQTFLSQIEKGANAIKDIFQGLLAAGRAIGAVASSVGSALFGGGTSERGFEFGDTIGNVIQSISTGLVSLIGGLGQVLIEIANAIRTTVSEIKDLVVRMYNFITGKGITRRFTGNNLGDLDPNLSKPVAAAEALARVTEAIRNTSTNNDPLGIKANRLNDLKQQQRVLQAQLNFLGGTGIKSPAQKLRDLIAQILEDLNQAFKPLELDAERARTNAAEARNRLSTTGFFSQYNNLIADSVGKGLGAAFTGFETAKEAIKPFLSSSRQWNEMAKIARNNPLFDGIDLSEIEGAGYITPTIQPPQELKAAVSALSKIASSITGSFEQTRGQKLQITAVDKQEETNALLADIKDNTEGLKNGVFL